MSPSERTTWQQRIGIQATPPIAAQSGRQLRCNDPFWSAAETPSGDVQLQRALAVTLWATMRVARSRLNSQGSLESEQSLTQVSH